MDQRRLSEMIAVQISELILSGKIEGGTKLRQEELADMLEVSRIPVREALQILQTQGLAKRLATRHIETPELDEEKIRETYAVLGQIESIAAEELFHRFGENVWIEQFQKKNDEQIHTWIRENGTNLYIGTLLENGYLYYVQHAEKLNRHGGHMADAYSKKQGSADALQVLAEVIKEHYQYLADCVIQERKKQ